MIEINKNNLSNDLSLILNNIKKILLTGKFGLKKLWNMQSRTKSQ